MSKATQNQARGNAKDLSQQAQTTLDPIAGAAGKDSSQSRELANSSLQGAGSTLDASKTNLNDASSTVKNTALPTLSSAGSSFGKMAATGGFTPEQESAYLNRATEGADASSEALQNQVQLQQARTGQGDNGGAVARIARQLGQVKSQSLNDAQVGLNSQRNANKIAGASGEAGVGEAQTRAADALTGVGNATTDVGRAQTGVGQAQAGMASQSAMERMSALGLRFNTEAEAQQALTQMSTNKGPWDNTMQAIGLATGQGGR